MKQSRLIWNFAESSSPEWTALIFCPLRVGDLSKDRDIATRCWLPLFVIEAGRERHDLGGLEIECSAGERSVFHWLEEDRQEGQVLCRSST